MAFLQHYLPKFARHLDLSSLRQLRDNYISEDLRQYFTDIVYACDWLRPEGEVEPIQVAFLLEHKSYVPDNIYIQLLRYLTETYQYQYQNSIPLQLTIPVVIYHGTESWQTRDMADYFSIPDAALKKYLPLFEYELINLRDIARHTIIKQKSGYFLRSTFLVFSRKNDKIFLNQFSKEIFKFVESKELDEDQKLYFLKQLITYIFRTYPYKKEEFQAFTQKLSAMTQTTTTSLWDLLLDEGFQKGIKKGIEEGIEEGIEKGIEISTMITRLKDHLDMLVRMLEYTSDMLLIQKLSGLPLEFIQQFSRAYSPEKMNSLLKKLEEILQSHPLESPQQRIAQTMHNFGFEQTVINNYLANRK